MYTYTDTGVDWQTLAKYENDISVCDPDHPFYSQYVRAVDIYNAYLSERIDKILRDYDIKKRARDNVLQRQYEELYRLQSLQSPTQIIKEIQTLRSSLGEKGEEISRPYIWLCVNPNSTYTFNEFQKLVSKMLSKVWLTDYVYVYEQRGITEEEMGKGFHLHAIIKKPDNKKPSHCVRELASTFKKCCDTSNYHFFQTKMIDESEKDRKLEYILGTKQTTDENQKDLKQAMDKVWRQKIGIPPYFFSNIDIGRYG